jgi:hypothetical protein
MRNHRKRIIAALSIVAILALSITAFAHGGRTDSSGGHKDNQNASGLGSYHYHHGYPAHLPPGGVCPYDTPATPEPTPTPTPAPTPAPTPKPAVSVTAKSSPSEIVINGKPVELSAYSIEGSNYVALRQLMRELDIYIGYDAATKKITIDSSKGYVE